MAVTRSTPPNLEYRPVSALLQNHSLMRFCACPICIASMRQQGSRSVVLQALGSQAGWVWHQLLHGMPYKFLISWHPLQHCRAR